MLRRLFNMDEWYGFALVFSAIVVGITAAVLLFVALVMIPISRHYDAAACHSFGNRTQRDVRFVNYTWWSWDCITPSSDGKWISTDRLWEETPGS